MHDYLFLMHQVPDAKSVREGDWPSYLGWLRETGQFIGGSAIGGGVRVSRSGVTTDISDQITGYLRVTAQSLQDACKLLQGNPAVEAGGVVEVRELPKSGD